MPTLDTVEGLDVCFALAIVLVCVKVRILDSISATHYGCLRYCVTGSLDTA